METDELVARFSRLPGALVGRGPKHPARPDVAVAPRLRSFLDDYPRLRQDPGYVDFLEEYAGAFMQDEGRSRFVIILGFSDVSLDMIEADGPVVHDGFLTFAQCIYHKDTADYIDSYQYDFSFDVSGERKSGVYWCFSTLRTRPQAFSWHLPDFRSWLAEVIEKEGVYGRPSVE